MQDNKDLYRRKKLFQYAKRAGSSLFLGFLFIILAVIADLVGPYVIGKILDNELVEGLGPRDLNFYILLLVVFMTSIILASIFRYFNGYFFNETANKVAKYMQEDVFGHVQSLPISYFDKLPVGHVVSRITNDTRDVKMLFQVVLAQMTTALVYALGIYISLIFIDYRVFLMGLIPIPFVFFIFVDFKNKSKKYNYAYRRHLSELNANLNENIQGMEVITAFNKQKKIYQEFDEINLKVYQEGLNYTILFAYSAFNAMSKLRYLTMTMALLYFGYGSLTGAYAVTIGLLYIFIDYMTKVFDQLTYVVLRSGELEKSRGAADHIFELLQIESNKYGDKKPKKISGNVEFKDVNFAYVDDNYVLQDISFTVEKGKSAAFVGHTGSGKSTIMNLLLGYYGLNSGNIYIDGEDIHEVDVRELRKDMSIVLQDPYLFVGTIKDNITLFDDSIKDEEVKRALLEVGGKEILDKNEKGIYTEVTEKGSTFSAGERQLISFARALVSNPKILVLDEATSNIDSETENYIQKGIEKLKEGRTTFIIAHRLSTIRHVDTIYVLDKGRIVEKGSHEELIELSGIYKEMYLAQSNSQKN